MRKADSILKKQCRMMERKLQNLFHETMDVMMASGQTDWFTEVVQS